MTRSVSARIAGYVFLIYIAAGLTSMVLFGRAAGGETIPEKLAGMAQHPDIIGVLILLSLVMGFAALTLAVTLYAITREQDPHLAMLAMVCRIVEGVMVGLSVQSTLDLHWLATATGVDAPGSGTAHALAGYLLQDSAALSATFFAAGSLLFAWLLLRGRMIPSLLAWIGVIASALLVIGLPLQLAGWLSGPLTAYLWLPMLAFEVPLGLWFIIKGVAANTTAVAAA